jgi:hypothetical protein
MVLSSFSHNPSSRLAGVLVAVVGLKFRTNLCNLLVCQILARRKYPSALITLVAPWSSAYLVERYQLSRLFCHADSFPQAEAECYPVEVQTAPLPIHRTVPDRKW